MGIKVHLKRIDPHTRMSIKSYSELKRFLLFGILSEQPNLLGIPQNMNNRVIYIQSFP